MDENMTKIGQRYFYCYAGIMYDRTYYAYARTQYKSISYVLFHAPVTLPVHGSVQMALVIHARTRNMYAREIPIPGQSRA